MNDNRYYHVRLTTKSAPDAPEFEFDLNLEDMKQRFIEPYDMGKPIVVNGKTVPMDTLEQLRISASNRHSDQLNSEFRAEARAKRHVFPLDPRGRVDAQIIFERADDETSRFITQPPGHRAEPQLETATDVRPATNAREVFVVHGRNERARAELFDFLRAIDLRPLEWADALKLTGKGSPYVGEALDAAFSHAHAIVVLFTPDDEVRLKRAYRKDGEKEESELSGQARPNVLFEAGMALGRDENRTILVELGNLRAFSDILGRHTVRPDKESGWRRDLANRLKTAGCPVDLSQTDWETAGDLESAIVEDQEGNTSHIEPQVELSDDAKELLMEGARDSQNLIWNLNSLSGLTIATNNKDFVEGGNHRSEARWKKALTDLEHAGLIEPGTPKRESFKVTLDGFNLADSLQQQGRDERL